MKTHLKIFAASLILLHLFKVYGNAAPVAYEDLNSLFTLLNYTWKSQEVPRVFVEKIPEQIKDLRELEKRRLFIQIVLPIVLHENEKIKSEHDLALSAAGKDIWNKQDIEIIKFFSLKYKITKEDYDFENIAEDEKRRLNYLLDHKIRPIPPAIAVGMAILESGWGTSRFVFEGNNMFGHVSKDPSKGLKPKNWSGNKRHIKIFDSISDSVSAYMLNLNRNKTYKKFRYFRALYPDNLAKMAKGFDRYSIIKEAYVKRLQTVMFKYGVYKINNAKLSETGGEKVLKRLRQPYIN